MDKVGDEQEEQEGRKKFWGTPRIVRFDIENKENKTRHTYEWNFELLNGNEM